MAVTMAEDAVAKRLAPMCVVQISRDPAKDQKMKELRHLTEYARADYVKKQGWATMPDERRCRPDRSPSLGRGRPHHAERSWSSTVSTPRTGCVEARRLRSTTRES
jgi:hypothetical protein